MSIFIEDKGVPWVVHLPRVVSTWNHDSFKRFVGVPESELFPGQRVFTACLHGICGFIRQTDLCFLQDERFTYHLRGTSCIDRMSNGDVPRTLCYDALPSVARDIENETSLPTCSMFAQKGAGASHVKDIRCVARISVGFITANLRHICGAAVRGMIPQAETWRSIDFCVQSTSAVFYGPTFRTCIFTCSCFCCRAIVLRSSTIDVRLSVSIVPGYTQGCSTHVAMQPLVLSDCNKSHAHRKEE